MRKLRINRKRWLRAGAGKRFSLLWDTDANAGCCLGHACKQISRLTERQLNGMGCPEDVFRRKSFLTLIQKTENATYVIDNAFAEKAIAINDSGGMSDKVRENKLIKLFRKNGIKLTFYGKGTPNEPI